MPVRIAAICGLLASITYMAGLLFGGLAQRDRFSNADHSTSDLGAATADSPWIYNRIGTNLTGLLMIALALGLWRALSPDIVGRVGASLLLLQGITIFLEGFFRLDCQGIDDCENTSSLSEGHRWVSRITAALVFIVPLVLAVAFRRIPRWRDTWLPTLAAIPLCIAVGVVFSAIGTGASSRALAVTWFLWLGFVAFRLLHRGVERDVPPPAPAHV